MNSRRVSRALCLGCAGVPRGGNPDTSVLCWMWHLLSGIMELSGNVLGEMLAKSMFPFSERDGSVTLLGFAPVLDLSGFKALSNIPPTPSRILTFPLWYIVTYGGYGGGGVYCFEGRGLPTSRS